MEQDLEKGKESGFWGFNFSENGCSEPTMPPEMGTGHRMARRAVFSALVVADAKCQQAWGQHPVYKVSAQLVKVWEDVKDKPPSTAGSSAHRQRELWVWCKAGRKNTSAEGSGVGIQAHRPSSIDVAPIFS